MTNTDGLNTFAAIPYSMAGEYGPALTDIRHRVSFGGTINAKWDFALNPLVTFYSGQPFDIRVFFGCVAHLGWACDLVACGLVDKRFCLSALGFTPAFLSNQIN